MRAQRVAPDHIGVVVGTAVFVGGVIATAVVALFLMMWLAPV